MATPANRPSVLIIPPPVYLDAGPYCDRSPRLGSDADKIRPPTLAALFAGSTKTVPVASSQAARQRRAAEVAPFTQPPPGGLAPCPLVEVSQNARALLWRQCGLFSGRLDSFSWPRPEVLTA